MTPHQIKVLRFINNFWIDNQYSPSMKEIQEGLNFSSATSVADICRSLIFRGYLNKIKYCHRNYEITEKTKELLRN